MSQSQESAAAAEAVAAMHRFIREVQQNGRTDLIPEFIHPDFYDHTSASGENGGIEGVYKVHEHIHTAVTNRTMEVVHCVSDGRVVATNKVLEGNWVGELFGLGEGSGEAIRVKIMDFMTWVDGRFKEHWATVGPIERV